MGMDVVSMHSVRANNQAGNIKVFLMTTQKGQVHKILRLGSRNLCILPENSVGGFGSRRERL